LKRFWHYKTLLCVHMYVLCFCTTNSFSVVYQEGASEGRRSWSQTLGLHQQTLCSHLKTRFMQKFRLKYAKNMHFGKKYRSRRSVGGGAPPPTPRSWPPASLQTFPACNSITTMSSSFLALNAFFTIDKEQNNYSKCYAFASSALFHLIFTSNSVF